MTEENTTFIIALICAIVFLFLTLFIPLTGVLGGFFRQTISAEIYGTTITQENEFMWDGVEETALFISITVSYDNFDTSRSSAGLFWNLCQLYGIIYILLTALGGGVLILDAIFKISKLKISFPLSFVGLVSGFVGTIGEWIVLFITIIIEDWSGLGLNGLTIPTPEINLLMLGIFIIGWILLICSYITGNKPIITKPEPVTSEI